MSKRDAAIKWVDDLLSFPIDPSERYVHPEGGVWAIAEEWNNEYVPTLTTAIIEFFYDDHSGIIPGPDFAETAYQWIYEKLRESEAEDVYDGVEVEQMARRIVFYFCLE